MSKQNPNEEIEWATHCLSKNKLTLDNTDIEKFDKESIRKFIATCNEVKLAAAKVLSALDRVNDEQRKMGKCMEAQVRQRVRKTWVKKGKQYFRNTDGQLWERSLTIPFDSISKWRKSKDKQ